MLIRYTKQYIKYKIKELEGTKKFAEKIMSKQAVDIYDAQIDTYYDILDYIEDKQKEFK